MEVIFLDICKEWEKEASVEHVASMFNHRGQGFLYTGSHKDI